MGRLSWALAAALLSITSYANGAMAALPTALAAEPIDDDALFISAGDAAIDVNAAAEAGTHDLRDFAATIADMNGIEFDEDMMCLASAVYNEARGESIEGQLAVAQVVLNRTASSRYAGTICEVVYAPRQFSFTEDSRPDLPSTPDAAWRRAAAIAIIAVTGSWRDVTDQALYFHATYVSPAWRHQKEQTRQIGRHVFYR